jgi:hypothetical protein
MTGGLNITLFSYNGSLDFGLIACREMVPDVWNLITYLQDAMAEMVALVPAPAKTPAAQKPPAKKAAKATARQSTTPKTPAAQKPPAKTAAAKRTAMRKATAKKTAKKTAPAKRP